MDGVREPVELRTPGAPGGGPGADASGAIGALCYEWGMNEPRRPRPPRRCGLALLALGACGGAPAMLVDEKLHEFVKPGEVANHIDDAPKNAHH